MGRFTAFFVATLIVVGPLCKAESRIRALPPTVRSHSSRAHSEVEELIDRLVEVDTQAFGTSRTSGQIQFIATDKRSVAENGQVSDLPEAHPVMRKLVQLGLEALPSLIDHLSDSRETHLTIGRDLPRNVMRMGAMWFANAYDPRFPEPGKRPRDVNTPSPFGTNLIPGKYVVRVGDLCYLLVGQIVDRELNCAQGQPTMNEVINSPIHSPELVAAVRRDWSGLTPADHERSLENDCYSGDYYRAPDGLKRLLFYYPEAGKRVGLDLIRRPIFENSTLASLDEDLWRNPDERHWRTLLGRASREMRPDRFAMIAWCLERNLGDDRFVLNPGETGEQGAKRQAVARLFLRFFPKYGTSRNIRFPMVQIDDQRWTLNVLDGSDDPDIKAAVARARKQIASPR